MHRSELFLGKQIKIQRRIISTADTYLRFDHFTTPGGSQKGPTRRGLSAHPSVHRFICPGVFFKLDHQFLLNFGTVSETHTKLCVIEPDFFEKFCAPETQKMAQKQSFLNLSKNLVTNFFLNLFYNESLYHLLCLRYSKFRTNLTPKTQTKMLLANQIADFLNQLYLQKKNKKKTDEIFCFFYILMQINEI